MLKTTSRGSASPLCQALISALLLGGGALNTSPAHAAGWTANGPPVTGYLCQLNDLACFNPAAPVDSPLLGDKFVTLLDRSTTVSTNTDVVEFSEDPDDPNTPWHLTLDFNPNRNNILNDTGFLKYKITITDPSKFFDQVKLSNTSSITNGAYTLVKTFWDPTFTTQIVSDALTNPPTPDGISLSGLHAQTLYVKDEWNVKPAANGVVDNIQNTFGQTTGAPAPLPLLGAGAALGLSRRLRSRIKASRLA